RRIVPVRAVVRRSVDRLEPIVLHVPEDPRPEWNAVADGESVRMRRRLLRAGEHVQSSEDDARASRAIPRGELIRSRGKSEVNRDADDLGRRAHRRRSLKKILVPVLDSPLRGRRPCHARQRESGCQDVLAEARMRILWVEGVDQKGKTPLDRRSGKSWRENRGRGHLPRQPETLGLPPKGLVGGNP